MSIEQSNKIDLVNIEHQSGDVRLLISDHLPWDENEGEHLLLLQAKLNAYLAYVEGGQMYNQIPETKGRRVVFDLMGNFL